MSERPIIAVMNDDLAQLPDVTEMMGGLHPVSVEHVEHRCERCRARCWIGPKQKALLDSGTGEALCYRCIFKDPILRDAILRPGGIRSTNFHIDDVPRKFT